ncbi:MAG: transglycosylase SLT domain-containing protein [Bryobacterales bacterium]|nr:transglycosylase SLT domain-containing protein [Bryobacterales bacterium]
MTLSGCQMGTSGHPQRFVRAFVPPAPKPVSPKPAEMPEPPPAESGFYLHDSPMLVTAPGPATPANRFEAGHRLAKSDEHLRKGTELLVKGKTAEARLEFDAAVDWLVSAPASLNGREKLVARHDQIVEEIFRLEVDAAQSGGQEQEPVYDQAPFEDVADLTFPIDPKLKLRVKEQVQATLSQLPLETTDAVLGFLNYFSTPKGRRAVLAGFKRSGRYAPMIRRILDEEGLPQELIHMAQAESGFLPRAVSRMRATGMWQFVRDRGNEYGLRQTPGTDDRLDPERATRAAARHLRDLYAQFGDWYLAIAAYNCGPGNVERGIQRTGYADFWELYKRNVLPRETANYLPIILAMTIMAKNPSEYGLDGIEPDEPVSYDTVFTEAPTHLSLIADITGQPLMAIREMNPSVLKLVAPAKYGVRVPKGKAGAVVAALDSIPDNKRAHWRIHRVGSADTLAAIARQYRTTEKQIHMANGGALDPEEGDLVVVPVSYPGAATARSAPAARKTSSRRASSRRTSAKQAGASRKAASSGRSASSRKARPVSHRGKTAASGKKPAVRKTSSQASTLTPSHAYAGTTLRASAR